MIRICFVCLGNICRSPTAHGIMEHLAREAGLEDAIEISSAGTGAYHVGERADRRSRATAQRHGVELHSRAEHFSASDFGRFDYVVAMDRNNREDLLSIAEQGDRAKVFLFRDFEAGGSRDQDVPDPYYGGASGFEDVFEICRSGCEGLLAYLRNEHDL